MAGPSSPPKTTDRPFVIPFGSLKWTRLDPVFRPESSDRTVTKPASYRAFLHRTVKGDFFLQRFPSLSFSASLLFASQPSALSTGPFPHCDRLSCIHETPMVPRFSALYRETKIFPHSKLAASAFHFWPLGHSLVFGIWNLVILPVLDTPFPRAHCRSHRGADLFRVRAGKLAESSALVRGRPFEPAPGNAGEGSLHFFLPWFPGQPINRIRIIL